MLSNVVNLKSTFVWIHFYVKKKNGADSAEKHFERPNLHRVLTILSAIGLNEMSSFPFQTFMKKD